MLKQSCFPLYLALAVVFAGSTSARAWNATGHEVVAEIAWNDLKPQVRAKVLALLKQHPQFERYLAGGEGEAQGTDEAMRVFMRASIWPDLVRGTRGKADPKYHHSDWHYIDFPIIFDASQWGLLEIPPVHVKLPDDNMPHNALQAMQSCVEQLTRPDVPASEKAVALAWLEHLVGDIHQPLHACELFNETYPKGDRGGNLFCVKYHGNLTNLHSFWDELLGGYMAFSLVDAVAKQTAEQHPRNSLETPLAKTRFVDWAFESFAIARDVVYAGGRLKGLSRDASNADKGATTPELPDEYVKGSKETAKRRAALAGYRLADVLNEIFK